MEKDFSLRMAILNNAVKLPQNDAVRQVEERAEQLHKFLPKIPNSLLLPISARAAITAKDYPAVKRDNAGILLPLDDLVLAKAGAHFLTGLGHNFRWNEILKASVKWAEENEASEDAGGSFGGKNFEPKRLTAKIKVSRFLLLQDNEGIDSLLEAWLMSAVMDKLEQTAFSTITGNLNIPDGLFADVPSKGAINWEGIVSMEGDLANAKALNGNPSYITHPNLLTKAKMTLKDVSGGGGFIANGKVNDYPVFRTTNIPANLGAGNDEYGIIFGNWKNLVIGQWGAASITTNPYTYLDDDMIEIVINSYWDFKVIREKPFIAASMK